MEEKWPESSMATEENTTKRASQDINPGVKVGVLTFILNEPSAWWYGSALLLQGLWHGDLQES